MIGFESTGFDSATLKIDKAFLGLKNLDGLTAAVGKTVVAQTRKRFDQQESPDGVPWADLAQETIKRKHGRTDKLVHKLDLLKSIQFDEQVGEVWIFSSLDDARVAPHQFGSPVRNIEARPFFGLSAENIIELEVKTLGWIQGLLT